MQPELLIVEHTVPASNHKVLEWVLAHAVEMVSGSSSAKVPKKWKLNQLLKNMISSIHHELKRYCSYHLHHHFGLHLPSSGQGSAKDHCTRRVQDLLLGYKFLRDSPNQPHFSSTFFEHFILDLITILPIGFSEFVLTEHLNNVFALTGAALNTVLHEFYKGVYKPYEVNEGNWGEYYLKSKQLLVGMQQQEGLC